MNCLKNSALALACGEVDPRRQDDNRITPKEIERVFLDRLQQGLAGWRRETSFGGTGSKTASPLLASLPALLEVVL